MAFDIASLIGGSIGEAFQKIMGVFKVDPTVAFQKQAEIAEIQLQLQGKIIDQVQGQLEVNKAEAANSRLFVAGWRPFIGWVCGSVFAYAYVLQPFLAFGFAAAWHPVALPSLDFSQIMPVLLGMLGLGAMRSYEKVQNAPGSDKLH